MTDHISKTRPDLWGKACGLYANLEGIEDIAHALLEAENVQRERDANTADELYALELENGDYALGFYDALDVVAGAIRKGEKS